MNNVCNKINQRYNWLAYRLKPLNSLRFYPISPAALIFLRTSFRSIRIQFNIALIYMNSLLLFCFSNERWKRFAILYIYTFAQFKFQWTYSEWFVFRTKSIRSLWIIFTLTVLVEFVVTLVWLTAFKVRTVKRWKNRNFCATVYIYGIVCPKIGDLHFKRHASCAPTMTQIHFAHSDYILNEHQIVTLYQCASEISIHYTYRKQNFIWKFTLNVYLFNCSYTTLNLNTHLFSPNFTFFDWIHSTARIACEISCKLLHITNCSDHSEFVWRMNIGSDEHFVEFRPRHGAPSLCGWNPKQLFLSVIKSRKQFFRPIFLHKITIGSIRFFNTAIIRDILSLSIHTVQLNSKITYD